MTNPPYLEGQNRQLKGVKKPASVPEKVPEIPPVPDDSGPLPLPNIPSLGASGPCADAQRRVGELQDRLRGVTRRRLDLVGKLESPTKATIDLDAAARELLAGNDLPTFPVPDDREQMRVELAQAEREEAIVSRAIAIAEGDLREARRRAEAGITALTWPWARGTAKRLLGKLNNILAIGNEINALVERAGSAGVSSVYVPMADMDLRKPCEELISRLVGLGLIGEREAPVSPAARPALVPVTRPTPIATAHQVVNASSAGELCEDQSW